MVTPSGWTFEGSLSDRFLFVHNDAADSIQFEKEEDNLQTWRSPLADGPVFIARTKKG
jgi:hypothetical protein